MGKLHWTYLWEMAMLLCSWVSSLEALNSLMSMDNNLLIISFENSSLNRKKEKDRARAAAHQRRLQQQVLSTPAMTTPSQTAVSAAASPVSSASTTTTGSRTPQKNKPCVRQSKQTYHVFFNESENIFQWLSRKNWRWILGNNKEKSRKAGSTLSLQLC